MPRNGATNRLRSLARTNRFARFVLSPGIRLRRAILHRKYVAFMKYYSSLFENVTDGCLVVRVPDFGGCFEIDFRSHLLQRVLTEKLYEPELAAMARKYVDPQRDVLDVGAHIGLYTVLFSAVLTGARRILAVEPTPSAVQHLRRNIARNGCDTKVIVFEGVATNRPGRFTMNTISGMEEYSSLGSITHNAAAGHVDHKVEVNGDTLDSLVAKFGLNPGLIKIDTEGAEFLVLSGAIGTLQRCKPVIMSELSDSMLSNLGHTATQVVRLLEENGYRVTNAEDPSVPVRTPFRGEILAVCPQ